MMLPACISTSKWDRPMALIESCHINICPGDLLAHFLKLSHATSRSPKLCLGAILGATWVRVVFRKCEGATLCWEQAGLSCVHASVALAPSLRAGERASPASFGNIVLYHLSVSGVIPISNVSLCIGSSSHINLEWLRWEENYVSVILTEHPLWNWGWFCCLCWTIPDLMLEWNWQMIPCMPWSILIQK